jgi:hypothetical protein
MNGAAQAEVWTAAAMVAAMQPGPARAAAAVAVAQKWFPQSDSSEPMNPETISWLSSLDAASVKQVLDQPWTFSWISNDPKTMEAFLAGAGNDAVPPYLDRNLAQVVARADPQGALDWAATLPSTRALDAGGAAFGEWSQAQPQAALAWLDALPADDPRRQPFFNSMVRNIAYSPQAAEQLSAMSPADQATAQSVIAKMPYLPDDQRARLLHALKTN